jgi:hypothetical protein
MVASWDVSLHLPFGRLTPIAPRIGIDESQILRLLGVKLEPVGRHTVDSSGSHTKGRHEWRYRVDLTEDDRNELAVLLSAGKRSERKLTGSRSPRTET